MKNILLATLVITMVGCTPLWVRTGGEFVEKRMNVSVKLPEGWYCMRADKGVFVATRDGLALQQITVERIHVSDELVHTKKKFSKGMLPHEQANIIIDNNATRKEYLNFSVESNRPAVIDNHKGFRLAYRYKTNGIPYRSIHYGFMQGDWFYGIRYLSPARHYFDRDSAVFEEAAESMKLLK